MNNTWKTPKIESALAERYDDDLITLRLGLGERGQQMLPSFIYRLPRKVAQILVRDLQDALK